MRSLKSLMWIIATFLCISAQAQEVTDYDLGRFAKAYTDMVKLNTQAQEEMAKIIKKEGLDLEVYHAINETREDSDIEPDVPQSDYDKYERIQEKIKGIQAKLEQDVENAYAKQELTKKEYIAIAERVKQDIILQTKLQKMLENIK